jgi:UDP-glucose 4-epimerase
VQATQVDTIVHTFLVVDSTSWRTRALHEVNVIGTLNLLAAAGAPGSHVRHVVMKSSTVVYGSAARDPMTFREDTPRSAPPQTEVERSLVDAERLVHDFAEDNPAIGITILRFANVLGANIDTPISRNLARPLCPSIFGYDPQLQFVEEGDVIRALDFVTRRQIGGTFNVAGAGRLPWSEVAAICRTRLVPLSPVNPGLMAFPFVRLGLVDLPPELASLLRYGRGVDTQRFLDAGFRYTHTSVGAVQQFVRARRLRHSLGRPERAYTYEHDVEQFFRHSPAVVRSPDG